MLIYLNLDYWQYSSLGVIYLFLAIITSTFSIGSTPVLLCDSPLGNKLLLSSTQFDEQAGDITAVALKLEADVISLLRRAATLTMHIQPSTTGSPCWRCEILGFCVPEVCLYILDVLFLRDTVYVVWHYGGKSWSAVRGLVKRESLLERDDIQGEWILYSYWRLSIVELIAL